MPSSALNYPTSGELLDQLGGPLRDLRISVTDRCNQVIARIPRGMPLGPVGANYQGETASRWRYDDGGGKVSVISSVTHAFCGDCNRARLPTESQLYTCLFGHAGHDLRALLRDKNGRERISPTPSATSGAIPATVIRNRARRIPASRQNGSRAMSQCLTSADKVIPAAITGLILEGSRGSRMGHIGNGLQTFKGLQLAAHAIARLAPQVGPLALNVNRSQAQYASFGLPLWPDLLPDLAGSLAGLQAGFSHCATPYLLCVPCDSPLLPLNLASRLAGALEESATDLALASSDREHDGDDNHPCHQRHPVFCLLNTALLPLIDDYLRGGGRKMEAWIDILASVDLYFGDSAAFSNINTLQKLQQLE